MMGDVVLSTAWKGDAPLGAPDVERDIAALAARAGFRLRFDRVALRVVGAVRHGLDGTVPAGQAVLFTLTAPVRRPARTSARIVDHAAALARTGAAGERLADTVEGNGLRLRWIAGARSPVPRALGFVHTPGPDPELLLDLAEARLIGP